MATQKLRVLTLSNETISADNTYHPFSEYPQLNSLIIQSFRQSWRGHITGIKIRGGGPNYAPDQIGEIFYPLPTITWTFGNGRGGMIGYFDNDVAIIYIDWYNQCFKLSRLNQLFVTK